MEDIALALIERIKQLFTANMANDPELAAALKAVTGGSTHYTDALDFSDRVGQALAAALKSEITEGVLPDNIMYYNIAKRLIDDVGGNAYDLASEAVIKVQNSINAASGIGLNAVSADAHDKAKRLMDITNAVSGKPYEDAMYKLTDEIESLPLGAAGSTMEQNIDFQGNAGLRPSIVRTMVGGCCEWCAQKAGTHVYPDVEHDVYRRHPNCRCTLEYIAGTKSRTLWEQGDTAQRKSQVKAKNAQIEKYNALTDEEKKKADAQAAARKKFAEKQQWTAEKNGATIKNEQEPTNATPSHRSFKSNELLQQHFEKHQQEYGTITEEEYLSRANTLAAKAPTSDVVQLQRSDGSISKYCYSTNDFIVINADGTVRTFFKPENGQEYWKYEIERNE